jgi:hypothetical protein
MAQDNKIISSLTPVELVALLRETAGIAVLESAVADGRPVIQAAVKAVNAQTGEVLPGGLPFSVVMFKNGNDTGYTNIAIGTVVPAAELDIHLPRDYFNFCNQRLRFTRVFPLDAGSFVIQMDLVLRGATREYVKFNIGLWSMLFKQVLYELIGSGRDSLVHAAEVYAATDVAQHFVSTLGASSETAEGPADAEPSLGPAPETTVAEAPQAREPVEEVLVETPPSDAVPGEDPPVAEAVPEPAAHDFETRSENVMMMSDPAEGKDEPEEVVPEVAVVAPPVDAEAFAVTLLDTPVAETPKAAESTKTKEAELVLSP